MLPDGAEIAEELGSGLPTAEFAGAVLRPGPAVPSPGPALVISPSSGPMVSTQHFDLALIV